MKKILILMLFIFVQLLTFGQSGKLPEKILISDYFHSPWGTHLKYEYELDLVANEYNLIRTFCLENDNTIENTIQLGTINSNIISQLVELISTDTTYSINPNDYIKMFAKDSINTYLIREGKPNLIRNSDQNSFLMDEFTSPDKLKKNIQLYFNDYDYSNRVDGPESEIKIAFTIDTIEYVLLSKSILPTCMPFNVNGKDHFTTLFSNLLLQIIPESKTKRRRQLIGKSMFNEVVRETISRNNSYLDYLETNTFKAELDSLRNYFNVSCQRVVTGTYTINWDGEKRLCCGLIDTSLKQNILIAYSTRVRKGKLVYPVSEIIEKHHKLFAKLDSINFFKEFLDNDSNRSIAIVFDDNNCFTQQVRESFSNDCILNLTNIDFSNSLFLSVLNERKSLSYWIVLPNGQYYLWEEIDGRATVPKNDVRFKKCK